jgi:hypothetical protein
MTDAPMWLPVVLLFGLLLVAYLAMWRGWRRRAHKHALPPLVEVTPDPAPARLAADAVYFGTTVSGDWLDRVVAQGLGARSRCRLILSAQGLDVLRPGGPFRIPAEALRGARHDRGIAGKVVPPHGVLVVMWQHGDYLLDTGFRLARPDASEAVEAGAASRSGTSVQQWHDEWVQTITSLSAAPTVESVEGDNP